ADAASRPTIVTSVFPIQNLIAQITGSDIRVDALVPSDASPHGYTPTKQDIEKIERANLVVCIGLGLDDWVAEEAKKNEASTIVLSDLLHEPAGSDPHLWMDPMLMANVVSALQTILVKQFPAQSPAIAAGVRRTVDSLFALDRWISSELSPFLGAGFVSYHGAFSRLAQRYGLATIAVIMKTPGVKPSPTDRADVTEKLKRFSRRVIFSEPQFDPEPAQKIAADAKAYLGEVDPIGGMRAPGRENYFRLMRYNVRQMVTAFQGKE
ncbi:metal ABC transporter substrate-binding protein, partial [bacterium]|nr:metal ABC transporter substrate-binding protein [bacterium]